MKTIIKVEAQVNKNYCCFNDRPKCRFFADDEFCLAFGTFLLAEESNGKKEILRCEECKNNEIIGEK